MAVKTWICLLLVLGGGVALWRTRAGASSGASGPSGAPTAMDEARRCLAATPGFEARTNPEAKGAGQLLVTTPAGRSRRDGNVTIEHDASVFLTFFKSPEDAERWSASLRDIAAQTGGAEAQNELIGTVWSDWNVLAPESERQAVRECVAR